jgi:hypothetical protein
VIGGKVLDASALAALARRRHSALVWFDIAPTLGLTLYLPSLALTEVRAIRPDAAALLADLLTHPSVIVGDSTPPPPARLTTSSPQCRRVRRLRGPRRAHRPNPFLARAQCRSRSAAPRGPHCRN